MKNQVNNVEQENVEKKKKGKGCLVAIVIFLLLGAVGSCLGDSSETNSSSLSDDNSVIETVATEENTEVETEEITTVDTDAENVETDAPSETKDSDYKFSKDDIASLMDFSLKQSMDDSINSNITYDSAEDSYIVTIWQDGFASIVSTVIENGTNQEEWQNVVDAYVALSNSLKNVADTADPDADSNVVVAILNDENLENSLLTIENGVVTYDVVASQS